MPGTVQPPELGKEAGELAEKVIKLGRALGITLLLATQRPDAQTPAHRCQRERGYAVLPAGHGPDRERHDPRHVGMYKNGVRATMFTRRDKGVGYLVGASDDPQITRTYYVDGPAAERITARARALREAAGTLTGHAIGQSIDTPASRRDTLLDDILTVVPAAEPKVWNETVLRPAHRATPRRLHRVEAATSSPPRSSRTASPPGRCGAPTPTPARARTGAASNATTSQRP